MIYSKAHRPRSGQAMLVAVLSIGGAILGATTIAGLLTLYQLRAAADSENSAKAIFAADAGTEWALFNYYCQFATPARCAGDVPLPGSPAGTLLASGAVASSTCYDASSTPVDCSDVSTMSAIATGLSGGARRAFLVNINGSTSTFP